jgi:hypothetical protein
LPELAVSQRNIALAIVLCLLTACATAPRHTPAPTPTPAAKPVANPAPTPPCVDCGVVEKIESLSEAPGQASARPALGGIVGGVVSSPSTQARPAIVMHLISLRLDDGRRLQVRQATISPNLRAGSRIKLNAGRVILLR